MPEQVLVLAPHPDDEVIGCGGSLSLHQHAGDRMHVVFLTSGERSLPSMPVDSVRTLREAEARAAARVLEIQRLDFLRLPDQGVGDHLIDGAERLQTLLSAPSIVYLPHPSDGHPDHKATLELARRALRGMTARLLAYEIWSPMPRCDSVRDITTSMRRKMRALLCYPSQLGLVRYDRAIRGLNRYRAIMNGGVGYAEAFQFV
jgi:LmbE family N-acetylglucosaminyl deacetylase